VQTVQKRLEFHNPITDGGAMYSSMITSLDTGTPIDFWGPLNMFLIQNTAMHGLTGSIAVEGIGEKKAIAFGSNVAYWPGVDIYMPGAVRASNLSQTLTFVDLTTNLEDLMANYTLSLLSIYQTPADLAALGAENVTSTLIMETTTSATSTSSPLVYSYTPVTLWQGYGVALVCSAVCVLMGSLMLHDNGVTGEMTFSQVLISTQNPILEEMSRGARMGKKHIRDQVKKVKVKYSKLSETEMGFVTEGGARSPGKMV
jgi:hypothetical protein